MIVFLVFSVRFSFVVDVATDIGPPSALFDGSIHLIVDYMPQVCALRTYRVHIRRHQNMWCVCWRKLFLK